MSGPKRLFWRIYLNGLLLIAAVTVAVTTTFYLVQPESNLRTMTVHMHQILAIELGQFINQPTELQTTLDRFAGILERNTAIYDREGVLLAAAGSEIPAVLDREGQSKLGGWHPLKQHDGTWVHAVLLGGNNDPYLLVEGTASAGVRFWIALTAVLATVALASWPLARAFVKPLERLTATSRSLAGGDLSARSGIMRQDEVGELAHALDAMAMRLEDRIRNEKELFANISHEIRTPLARLRVALELCEDVPGDAAQTLHRLHGMATDLAELERLVDNVLVSGRLDLAGNGTTAIPLQPKAVILNDFFAAVEERFTRYHPGQTLQKEIEACLPQGYLDPQLLSRVCDNLLENAVKYSTPGCPVVLKVAVDAGQLWVEVINFGEGVHEQDLPRLFEPFFRSDPSRSRQTGGTGLGLTLCKRIIEGHGGKIFARNNNGKGMSFRFMLPISGCP